MGIRDYYKNLEIENNVKSKNHLSFSLEKLDEEEFSRKFSFLLNCLDDYDVANITFSFSCDYWESDCLDEEDF